MDWWWWKKNKKLILERGAMVLKDLIEFGHGQSNPIKFFSADEIRKVTNYFSDSKYVSRLGYPFNWYSGKNENHPMILIKEDDGWWSGFRVDLLCRDIAVSSMVSGHKNFLKLVGCCLELENPFLVYHGVKKHYRLDISEETWKRRMKIAQDIATALAYLHTAFPRPFVYRSLSLRKILLDEDGVAKLTDFSYCVSIPEGETFVKVDEKAHGFYSYLDDNYKSGGVVSEKTDVFAFGMFMGLTLLLGNRSIEEAEESRGRGFNTDYYFDRMRKRLAQNVMSKLKEDRRMEEIVDPKMIEKMGQISEQELCQMEAFRMLSLRCIGPSEEVPTMVEVAKELKKIQRSLQNDSSSPSGETHFDSNQDISPSGEMGWLRKKKPKSDVVSDIVSVRGAMVLKDLIECCDGKSNPIKFFSADEILKATNNFSDSNLVCRLAYYYKWYSGKNENHPMILIKIDLGWWSGFRKSVGLSSLREDHLCRDIAVSSMVSGHKNFLKLVGCCLEFEKPVLVYHGVKKHYGLDISEQPWKRRMKIAEDIATAFAYLHTAFPRPFVYTNLSHRNILLDEDGVAKLTDFSLCVSIPEGETFVKVDREDILHSFLYDGYMSSGVVSEKTDVFAFGMFMGLRLLLGFKGILGLYDGSFQSKLKEDRQIEEIADRKMIEKMGQISEQELCQMEAFRMLSLRCTGPSEEVPTMVEVAKELKKIQRSLQNDSSSPSGETHFDSAQDISSSALLSNHT